jgi:hypothetical protein
MVRKGITNITNKNGSAKGDSQVTVIGDPEIVQAIGFVQ